MSAIDLSRFVWAILAGAILLSWTSDAACAEPESSGSKPGDGRLQPKILAGLENVYSIQARLHFEASVLGKKWSGQGEYAEVRSGPVPKSRMELRSALTGAENRLVQVCDGKDIWIHDGIENADRIVRIDATRCHEAVKATGAVPLVASLGVGGMPGLLRSLESVFYFEGLPGKGGGVGKLGVRQLEGTLRRSVALRFLDEREDEGDAEGSQERSDKSHWKRLPDRIPTHVVLHFGTADPIPVVIEYYRYPPGSRGSTRLMRLAIEEVALNEPIDESRFVFVKPEGVEVVDRTDAAIQKTR